MALQTFRTNNGDGPVRHPVSVAKNFTIHPGPRYIRQGQWSGEKFRKLLESRLKSHDLLTVNLDGTRGYGSSFLDEAFGGLIREGILTREEFERRIQIVSDEDPTYLAEALDAVRLAKLRQ